MASPPVLDDVSVLIASRERPAMLSDTVASLLAGDALPREVVVVDQSATPHPGLAGAEPVRGCAIRYVHAAGRGLSGARNLALHTATAPTVALLDDDMYVEGDWLRRLADAVRTDGGRTVASGRVLPAPAEGPGRSVPPSALLLRDEPAEYAGTAAGDVLPGAGFAAARAALLDAGGYDERLGPGTSFPAAEDNDLGFRLLQAGCVVRHVPEAVALHRAWRSRGERLRLRWTYGRGQGAFYAKHRAEDPVIRRRLTAEIRKRARRGVTLAARHPARALQEWAFLGGLLTGAAQWAVQHRR